MPSNRTPIMAERMIKKSLYYNKLWFFQRGRLKAL